MPPNKNVLITPQRNKCNNLNECGVQAELACAWCWPDLQADPGDGPELQLLAPHVPPVHGPGGGAHEPQEGGDEGGQGQQGVDHPRLVVRVRRQRADAPAAVHKRANVRAVGQEDGVRGRVATYTSGPQTGQIWNEAARNAS
jgi:hypothetical protein